MKENDSIFGDAIYSYSRRQAIEDGVLVELIDYEIVREHWKLHLACTDTLWDCMHKAVMRDGKDMPGILHDISTIAKLAIRAAKPGDSTIFFEVIIGTKMEKLKLHCGPGDDAVPVLTLMFQNES